MKPIQGQIREPQKTKIICTQCGHEMELMTIHSMDDGDYFVYACHHCEHEAIVGSDGRMPTFLRR